MPRNKSKPDRGQPTYYVENNQVLGELKSIDTALIWLRHTVDGLDKKVDSLIPAQPALDQASETDHSHLPTSVPAPLGLLDAQ